MPKKTQKGFFLIEAIVASAIIGTSLVLMLAVISNVVDISHRALEKTQASYLLEEGGEVAKVLRNQAWSNISNLTPGTTYYMHWDNTGKTWSYTTTAEKVGVFTRTIVISSVQRNANADIVSSGGSVDSGTLQMTISVSWQSANGTSATETMPFYITSSPNI
ncbi:MAG: type II secretion system protein [bacterium]